MVKVRKRAIPANTQLSVPSALLVPFRYSVKKFSPPPFDIPKPVLYYPVGGLHGKLTVTAKLAPGCPAFPCGVRRHDAALEPGDMSPRPSPRLVPSARNQTKSNQIKPPPLFAYFAVQPPPPPIKAKTPAIVPNQASSRHRPNFPSAVRSAIHPLDRSDRQTNGKTCTKQKSSPEGEDSGEGECHHQSIPFCASPPPIKAKTPAIVHDQGISRHWSKTPVPLDAWSFPTRTPKPGNRAQRRPLFPIDIRARAWLIF